MRNPYLILKRRGFVQRETRPKEGAVEKLFEQGSVTCYIGFDSTAKSLHVGHLLGILALYHIKMCGHRPLVLLGGATTLIGDPSGKQEMRKLLPKEEVEKNAQAVQRQIEKILGKDGVIYENNAKWFGEIKLIDFLREVGAKFTIAEMLTTETYKTRLQKGLTFLEFSYQLFQAYDFLHLYRHYGCKLQMGGDDQWGNICAGVDLIRKIEGAQVEGLTFPLLLTSTGAKMGKTEKGALWLDPELTPPYEFYQYWMNISDQDTGRFLRLFTLLPLAEIEEYESLKGADIRKAKEVLAFEVTRLVHGEEEAKKAQSAARSVFYGQGENRQALPTAKVTKEELEKGIPILEAFLRTGLIPSKGEGKRKLREGSLYVNGERIQDLRFTITSEHLEQGEVTLRFGKKRYARLVVEE